MCSSRIKRRPPDRAAGFTLLEIMIAIAIMGLVSIAIFRFVETTVSAVQISNRQLRETALTEAFAKYLRFELMSLPPSRSGALSGDAHRFNSVSSDELRWIATPGAGLLTAHASGEWNVSLTTRQLQTGGYELGLRRQDVDGKQEASWYSLLPNVTAFEVRYYDTRVQTWLEKWTDLASRPALVRIRLWRSPSPDPYEMILPVPAIAVNVQNNQGGAANGTGLALPATPAAPPNNAGNTPFSTR